MPLTIEVQVIIIISSIISGLITGCLFDIYRLIRGENVPKIIVIIEDLLFWSLAAVTIFAFLLYTNYAFLNPYVYIFIFLAIIFYLKFLSPFVIGIEKKLFSILYKIIRISLKFIIYPIKILYCIICGKSKSNKKMS